MSRNSATLRRSDTPATTVPILVSRVVQVPAMLRSRRLLVAIAVLGCATAAPAFAEERFASVLFQNDVFFGRDGGGYTNGVFASFVRVTSPGESSVEPSLLMKPIAGWLGLPQATLASSALGQIMVTPRDLTMAQTGPQGRALCRGSDVSLHAGVRPR